MFDLPFSQGLNFYLERIPSGLLRPGWWTRLPGVNCCYKYRFWDDRLLPNAKAVQFLNVDLVRRWAKYWQLYFKQQLIREL